MSERAGPPWSGGHDGQNLLGLALMRVRGKLVADVRAGLASIGAAR